MYTRPTIDSIRLTLSQSVPQLAGEEIEFLGEGWSVWAFRAGDHVLRFPQRQRGIAEIGKSGQLMREVAAYCSLPVPVQDVYVEGGPNGAPFDGYRMLPGVSLISAARLLPASARDGAPELKLSPAFGRQLGRFLHELHSFPFERAVELGLPYRDGPAQRQARAELYADVVREVFPLTGCEARMYLQSRFEAYLNDDANFRFRPRLVHNDLDRQNLLIDPGTGDLSGVIDFTGDVHVGNPAGDLWLAFVDFPRLGISDQLDDFIAAYDDLDLDLERARIEAEFIEFSFPCHDILHGLSIGDAGFVAEGIRALNAAVPADVRC